jgi:5-deoxy-glucuronate isomerase
MNNLVFRKTNAHRGRRIAVTPENSAMKHLCYGRIILDQEVPRVQFETGNKETGLICLSGKGRVSVGHQSYELDRYDAVYVPRNSSVEVSTETSVDLAECSAEVEGEYPIQFVPYADVEKNGSLKFTTGDSSSKRTVNILLGKNIRAGRILAGVTCSEPGNWTSWPPHEHASMLEELYVYYDMPAPAFGVQLVYTNPEEPELITIVREGDAVLMPQGFHPNVAIPGYPINFLWMMAAHREVQDREYGVVTVQPGFDKKGTGLEASRS